ncbi:MAG: ribosomal L7Ae/L30e/S12e/Gadd45 family protein [Acholeplasmataceae bacterium]|nr:ribosomal L7Ae/L30e/S12e/Gadd45 family protein [Acholeplasmataceae bacterium]
MNHNLGLAFRARKITVGTDLSIQALRNGQLYLILLATDASDLTKKKVYDKSKTYQVEVIENLSSIELSQAIGKQDIKVIGITDRGFSQLLMNEKRK